MKKDHLTTFTAILLKEYLLLYVLSLISSYISVTKASKPASKGAFIEASKVVDIINSFDIYLCSNS